MTARHGTLRYMTNVEGRRLVDRIIDPSYIEGLESKSLEELKAMREECREGESEISFERRLCQARIDILMAELDRRSGTGGDLLSRLPQILADESPSRPRPQKPLPERAPDFSLPRNVDVPRRRVEEIVGENTLARLDQLSSDEIRAVIDSLADHERNLSARRRQIHDVMDTIQAQFVNAVRAAYPSA